MSRDHRPSPPGSAATAPPWRRTGAFSALLLGATLGLALCDPLTLHPVQALLCFAAAFAAYALAVRASLADEGASRPWALGWVIATAVLCRAVAFPSTPSDDLHRYLWEGRVLAAGHDPYRLAPDADELAALADAAPEHGAINHPDWTAIYPPFMQWWQRAVVGVRATERALKTSFLLAEVALGLALWRLLLLRGLPPARLLIYAWNPLAVQATAAEGHHDVVAAALLMSALLLLVRGRAASAATAFACAVLAKGFALAALPAILANRGALRAVRGLGALGRIRLVALPLLAVTALSLPFLLPASSGGPPPGPLHSLGRFGAEMHTNDSLHALASSLLPGWGSRLAMLVILAAATLVVVLRGSDDLLRSSAVLIGCLLLTLPTVHPWYLVVLLPFLCFFPWWGWIAFSGSVALTWLPHLEIQRTGQWVEWPVIKLLEYAPLFAWLGLITVRRCRREWFPPVTDPTVAARRAEQDPSS